MEQSDNQNLIEQENISSPENQEKMLTQTQVNDIVKRVRMEEAEKARQEALSSMQSQYQGQQPNIGQMMNNSMGGMTQHSEEDIRRMINEEAQRYALNMHANNVASEFKTKLDMGKERYSDFDEKIGRLKLSNHPDLVLLANSVDNTADVMHDLAEHPEKFVNLSIMAEKDPELALMSMQRLSESIKQNQNALNQPYIKEPIPQVSRSTIGSGGGYPSGSIPSVRDFKSKPWARG